MTAAPSGRNPMERMGENIILEKLVPSKQFICVLPDITFPPKPFPMSSAYQPLKVIRVYISYRVEVEATYENTSAE